MAFAENKVLFGHDPTERIVAVEPGDSGGMIVYERQEGGETTAHEEAFAPFLWAD